jgi:hypothetical protein
MRARIVSIRFAVLGVVIATSLAGRPGLAQEGPGPFPELDGHRFSPTRVVPVPTVNSYVVSTLGAAQAVDITTPPFVIDGDTIPGLQGDLLFATLDLEYQQKIVDWFAFRVGYRIDARLGTELGTLLSKGVNTITGFEIGWLARLLESDRDILLLDARVSNKNITTVDIVRKNTTLRAATGVRWAHTFSNLFGIVANGELGLGESADRNTDEEVFTRLGAQLDFDLDAWRDIPLNVALGYQFDSYPEATEDVDGSLNTGYVRLSYIARNDFTVGLQFFGSSIPVVNDESNLKYGGIEFDLRYFF